MCNNIGMNLKNIRKNKGMTAEEFSRKICIPISKINLIESGKIDVPISVLMKYSKFFNISLDDLCMSEKSKKLTDAERQFRYIANEVSSNYKVNIEGKEFYNLLIGTVKFSTYIGKLDNRKKMRVMSLYKIILKSDISDKGIDGIIEMFNLFNMNNELIFSNEELNDILNIIKDIVSVDLSKDIC